MPRSLFYCHPAVMEAFEEYSRSMVGAAVEPTTAPRGSLSRQSILCYLEQLESSIRERPDEVYQRAAQRLSLLRSEVAVHHYRNEQIDRDLTQITAMILDSLRERLDPGQLRELEGQVKKEMKIYRRRLSRDMYVRLEKNYLDRKLREFFQVPEFSLLQVGKES